MFRRGRRSGPRWPPLRRGLSGIEGTPLPKMTTRPGLIPRAGLSPTLLCHKPTPHSDATRCQEQNTTMTIRNDSLRKSVSMFVWNHRLLFSTNTLETDNNVLAEAIRGGDEDSSQHGMIAVIDAGVVGHEPRSRVRARGLREGAPRLPPRIEGSAHHARGRTREERSEDWSRDSDSDQRTSNLSSIDGSGDRRWSGSRQRRIRRRDRAPRGSDGAHADHGALPGGLGRRGQERHQPLRKEELHRHVHAPECGGLRHGAPEDARSIRVGHGIQRESSRSRC